MLLLQAWYYRLGLPEQGSVPALVGEHDYLGSVEQLALNHSWAAVLFDGESLLPARRVCARKTMYGPLCCLLGGFAAPFTRLATLELPAFPRIAQRLSRVMQVQST